MTTSEKNSHSNRYCEWLLMYSYRSTVNCFITLCVIEENIPHSPLRNVAQSTDLGRIEVRFRFQRATFCACERDNSR